MMNIPSLIKLHQDKAQLEVVFAGGQTYHLPCEYLRVYSPSAEVRRDGDMQLVDGKRHVNIKAVDAVGNYAVKIAFDDGHQSGIYTWEMLYELGANQDAYWQKYLDRLQEAGKTRDPVKS